MNITNLFDGSGAPGAKFVNVNPAQSALIEAAEATVAVGAPILGFMLILYPLVYVLRASLKRIS